MGTAAQNQIDADNWWKTQNPVQQTAFKSALGAKNKADSDALYNSWTPDQQTQFKSALEKGNKTPIDHTNPLANVSTYKAEKAVMGDSDSVESRIDGIIKHDSPLMQSARLDADRQSSSRGLLNSSMAVGAAQNAVIKNALSIASQDATTSAQFNLSNQNAANNASQFNTDQTNAANTVVFQANRQKELQDDAQAAQTIKDEAQQVHEVNLQNLTNDQVLERERIAGDFDIEISSNQSAAGALLTYDNAVAAILNNPEMTTPNKILAIDLLSVQLETSLTIIASATGDADKYTDLLNFGQLGSGAQATTPTPPRVQRN